MYQFVFDPKANAVSENIIKRLSDNSFISLKNGSDEADSYDYKKYKEWLNQGNEPLPADE